MYTAFYGLREKPFALVPDPRYLFLADAHREALAHLLYGIDQGEGFIAVTGEVGTGKTTLCRTLLERLGAETEVAFLFNPSRSGVELLQDISVEFGLDASNRSRSELGAALNRFLLQKNRERRRVLLIIDEAQNLSPSTLEQVRLLSNLETASSKLIQILLLGQPELDRKLDSPELRQLRQRISVRWNLRPLAARETRAYVRHRLHVAAGAERNLFSEAALREIHRRTRGVPRLINVLCDRALLAGYVARAGTIGPPIVRRAAREIPDARRSLLTRRVAPAAGRQAGARAALGLALPLAAATLVAGAIAAEVVFGPRLLPEAASVALRASLASAWDRLGAGSSASSFAPDVAAGVASAPPVAPAADAPAVATAGFSSAADAEGVSEEAASPEALVPLDPYLEPYLRSEPGPAVESGVESPLEGLEGGGIESGAAPAVPQPAAQGSSVIEPGAFLGLLMQGWDVGIARLDATNAILKSYGKPAGNEEPADDAAALDRLRDGGLALLELEDADLGTLRSLNHPALLRVEGEAGEPGLLALRELDRDLALVYGLTGDAPLRVPADELEEQWTGNAWVVWQDFESARRVLAFGERGSSVTWLQEALAELGYYDGTPSGLFDRPTRQSLQAFQRGRMLEPDGLAGPRTRMVLYDVLDRYEVPRLAGRPAPPAVSGNAPERLEDAG